jgi:hypothetical protein
MRGSSHRHRQQLGSYLDAKEQTIVQMKNAPISTSQQLSIMQTWRVQDIPRKQKGYEMKIMQNSKID